MTQHTPGPWTAERLPRTNQWSIIPHYDDSDRRSVASAVTVAGEPPMNTKANARLIASAPELLAVLQSIKIGAASGYTGYTRDAAFYEIATAAQAAIAKAEEGS